MDRPGIITEKGNTYIAALRNLYEAEIYPEISRFHEQLFLVKFGWDENRRGLITPEEFTLGLTTYKTVKTPSGNMTIDMHIDPYKDWKGGVYASIIYKDDKFVYMDHKHGVSTYYKSLLDQPVLIGTILLNNY